MTVFKVFTKCVIALCIGIFGVIGDARACASDEIDTGSQCVTTKFSITTSHLGTADKFDFGLSAAGTFYVDCGDGGTLYTTGATVAGASVSGKTITNTNTTTLGKYVCRYTTSGIKTIRFGGVATGYASTEASNAPAFKIGNWEESVMAKHYVTEISGSLGALFPTLGQNDGQQPVFRYTFGECDNLTSIPENLFSGITGAAKEMFAGTFAGCSKITTIPENLFSGITGNATGLFSETFYNCKKITSIPENLFSGITGAANNMFWHTFDGCTSITGPLSENLFRNISGSAMHMFSSVFGNTAITSIPENILSGFTGGYGALDGMFSGTKITEIPVNIFKNITDENTSFSTVFANTKITEIPEDLFRNITWTTEQNMFFGTFSGCTELTSIPERLFRNVSEARDGMFYYTFRGCTKLTEIPEKLFNGVTGSGRDLFDGTFMECTGLTSIPEKLFSGVSGAANRMFVFTFQDCTGLTSIPEKLFSGVSGSADGLFSNTFKGCTGLTGSIPENLFSGVSGNGDGMFWDTFNGCAGLTGPIPENLFRGVTGADGFMFNRTFMGCSGLTGPIPSGLFSGVSGSAFGMFWDTFNGCTGITEIPSDLFSGVTGGASHLFEKTFEGCTGITELPEYLFAGITNAANSMFADTFKDCSNLTGYIPMSMFAGLVDRNSPDATDMMKSMFDGTSLSSSCPAGTEPFTTGYNGYLQDVALCYTPTEYTITYDLDGGENYAGAPITYMSGTGATIDGMPTKAHNEFLGWCVDAELTNCAASQTITLSATGNKTFYAKWEQIELVCRSGEYFSAEAQDCEVCPMNHYCPGGTLIVSDQDSGISECPDNLVSPYGTSASGGCGVIMHVGDDILYLTRNRETLPALAARVSGDVYYAQTTPVSAGAKTMNSETVTQIHVMVDEDEYTIHDNTTQGEI